MASAFHMLKGLDTGSRSEHGCQKLDPGEQTEGHRRTYGFDTERLIGMPCQLVRGESLTFQDLSNRGYSTPLGGSRAEAALLGWHVLSECAGQRV